MLVLSIALIIGVLVVVAIRRNWGGLIPILGDEKNVEVSIVAGVLVAFLFVLLWQVAVVSIIAVLVLLFFVKE